MPLITCLPRKRQRLGKSARLQERGARHFTNPRKQTTGSTATRLKLCLTGRSFIPAATRMRYSRLISETVWAMGQYSGAWAETGNFEWTEEAPQTGFPIST